MTLIHHRDPAQLCFAFYRHHVRRPGCHNTARSVCRRWIVAPLHRAVRGRRVVYRDELHRLCVEEVARRGELHRLGELEAVARRHHSACRIGSMRDVQDPAVAVAMAVLIVFKGT